MAKEGKQERARQAIASQQATDSTAQPLIGCWSIMENAADTQHSIQFNSTTCHSIPPPQPNQVIDKRINIYRYMEEIQLKRWSVRGKEIQREKEE